MYELLAMSSIALIVYGFYSNKTTQLAYAEREKMLGFVKSAIHSKSHSDDYREIVGWLYVLSVKKSALPRMVWATIVLSMKKDKGEKRKFTSEEKQLLNKFWKEHFFPTNMAASPHWYVLLAIVVAVGMLVTLAVLTVLMNMQNIQSSYDKFFSKITNPPIHRISTLSKQ